MIQMDLLFIFQCTFYKYIEFCVYGAVAQLARAPALQAGGQEFDSPQLHHTDLNISMKTYASKYIEKYIDEIR